MFQNILHKVPAILWDGVKKLNGELLVSENEIKFRMTDFTNSSLSLSILIDQVLEVKYESIYDLEDIRHFDIY